MTRDPAARPVVIVVHMARAAAAESLVCDVRELTSADERALEALTRLQLTAHRLGTTIRLRHASRALVDLIELAGLSDVLVREPSDVEVDGQVEQREVRGVDEEVDPGDDAA